MVIGQCRWVFRVDIVSKYSFILQVQVFQLYVFLGMNLCKCQQFLKVSKVYSIQKFRRCCRVQGGQGEVCLCLCLFFRCYRMVQVEISVSGQVSQFQLVSGVVCVMNKFRVSRFSIGVKVCLMCWVSGYVSRWCVVWVSQVVRMVYSISVGSMNGISVFGVSVVVCVWILCRLVVVYQYRFQIVVVMFILGS